MQQISIGASLPQIILPGDGTKAGRKISSNEHGWQCQGQSLKLCQRAEGSTIQVRKPSTLLAPPPQRRRRSSTNSTTGSQSSCSQSEQNNSSDGGSSIKSDRKIQSDFSDGTTKTNDGKTTGVDKLPNIIAEKRKNSTTRKNERKRKKSQVKNAANRSRQKQAAAVKLKKENEDEVKYGLDLTTNCRPGLDITRPYIFSYFPKIVNENEKQIQNGGKDSTTSKAIVTRKFLAR